MAFSGNLFSTDKIKRFFLSNAWACSEGIENVLDHYLGKAVHIVAPELGSIYTPLSHAEGIKAYAEKIAGHYAKDGELQKTGYIQVDGGTLAKPIVMVINTHIATAKSSTDTKAVGGLHWVCCVVLPKTYTILGQTFTHPSERMFFFDSMRKTPDFPENFIAALKKGFEFTLELSPGAKELEQDPEIELESSTYSSSIPAAFPELEVIKDSAFVQQSGASDCGWWAVYNSLMTVLTGGNTFMQQFANPYRPQRAAGLLTLFPGLAKELKKGEAFVPEKSVATLDSLAHTLLTVNLFPPQVEEVEKKRKPEKKPDSPPRYASPSKKEKLPAVEIEIPKPKPKPVKKPTSPKKSAESLFPEGYLENLDDFDLSEFNDFDYEQDGNDSPVETAGEDEPFYIEEEELSKLGDPKDLILPTDVKAAAAKSAVSKSKQGDDRDISEVDLSQLHDEGEAKSVAVAEAKAAQPKLKPPLVQAQRETKAAEVKVAKGIAKIYQHVSPSKHPALFDEQGIFTKELSATELKELKLDKYFPMGMSQGVTVYAYDKDAANYPPIVFMGEQNSSAMRCSVFIRK